MIIHSLTLKAYGPFPREEHIDFERLNEAGIFLLNGPTGAGKTSILDAISFALYGETPTVRPQLRSRFANEHDEPGVELEFTVGSERLKIVRNPRWDRPKLKGTGFTPQNAKALLQKLEDGQWKTLSTGHSEAAGMIQDRIGLNREQFSQVILLPQGEFAKFLNAKSDEREALLKKLFDTKDFQTVQEQLQERARSATAASHTAQQAVDALTDSLKGMSQQSTHRKEHDLYQEIKTLVEQDGSTDFLEQLQGYLTQLEDLNLTETEEETAEEIFDFVTEHTRLRQQLADAGQRLSGALYQLTQTHETSQGRVQHLRKQLGDWQRFATITQRKRELDARADDIAQTEQQLQAAQRAAPVLPAIQQVATSTAAYEKARQAYAKSIDAEQAAHAVLTEIPPVETHPEATVLSAPEHQLSHQIAQALSALDRLEKALADRERTAAQRQQAQSELEKAEHAQAELSVAETQHREQTSTVIEQLTAFEGIERELEEAQHSHQRAVAVVELSQQWKLQQKKVASAETVFKQAEATRRNAAQAAEDIQQLRFSQAAYLLAQQLQANEKCPVCGSAEHPAPATAPHDTQLIEQGDIDAAIEHRNRAEKTCDKAQTAFESAHQKLKELVAKGAVEPAHAAEAEIRAKTAVEGIQQRISERDALHRTLTRLEEQGKKLEAKLAATAITITQQQQLVSVYAQELDRLQLELEGRETERSVATRKKLVCDYGTAAAERVRLKELTDSESERLDQAKTALTQLLMASEFETAEHAEKASLPAAEIRRLNTVVSDFRTADERLTGQLEDPVLQAVAQAQEQGVNAPDSQIVEDLETLVKQLADARDRVIHLQAEMTANSRALVSVGERYERQAEVSQSLVDEAARWNLLAKTANGSGSDNSLNMTLTTYVLAAQLREVTANASDHLKRMTHGRYTLKYSHEREKGKGRGNSRAGLGIVVHDAWHDDDRPTKSLSGGETFMASLALALGLAEAVQQRSGGIDIDTLFVDEGFGSLDDSTLEEVMNTLDSLRAGGRVIGLISHVAEMKNRIPTQVQVNRSPEGSSLVIS
ncbi:AAA family ATPase [Rothia sp. ZJ1223]|uniref:AAA family ATPase n=1 Tax=Rothia sp. ZJ1223 TaxID=2811098 RepID=UPI001959D83B|nr:SMC family ATPase [Rothia sp. ZJ1223]MBM7050968.1 SMC family ATPase [Rothia sp. ZJ1223]